jgi:hypothetical protein
MIPFGVTIPATAPQVSKIPEGLMDNLVFFQVASFPTPFIFGAAAQRGL